MAEPLITAGSTVQCPHGGRGTFASGVRVRVEGQAAVTAADPCLVVGCAPGSTPPCARVQWVAPATRVRIAARPALVRNSQGLCQNAVGAPQGPPAIVSGSIRVKGV